jgi:hypothetical protein
MYVIFKFYFNHVVKYTGSWSDPDHSKEWTTKLLEELNGKFTNSNDIYKFKNDSCFFVSFADFCDNWHNVSPVRVIQYEKGMFYA